MKRYRLKKDLPTFRAGDVFTLSDRGDLYKDIGEQIPILVYSRLTIDKFPNILKDWFEEISEETKTVWDIECGDEYYYISWTGDIEHAYWSNFSVHESARESGNCFLSEEDAKKELARRKAKVILELDTKGFKPDWSNEKQPKYEVSIVHMTGDLLVSDQYVRDFGTIVFATSEDARESIKNHEKEWKIYLGVEE